MFLQTLDRHCRRNPDKIALEFLPVIGVSALDARISYGELEREVGRTMAYLRRLGVQPGDRVALQLPKCLPFIYLHLAVMRLGAISLPLNPAYPADELSYFLSDAGVSVYITDEAHREQVCAMLGDLPDLRECVFLQPERPEHFLSLLSGSPAISDAAPPVELDTTALMIYTSGTTGRPKGAEITHGNLAANLEALHVAWGWQEDDVLLHVLPIFHVHGLVVALMGALYAGATTLFLPRFDAELTLQTLVRRRCTVFMAVPTIHRRLLEVPDPDRFDLRHMRLLTSGSDRLPDDVFAGFQRAFGHTLLERYGMTETGMNLSNPLRGERRIGSVGLPLPGVEARIVHPETGAPLPDGEIGEVQIRGPHVCKGYWRQPEKSAEAFTADGWLRTGDLGLREADGYFTLKGRAKDLIITGGLNVYPPEVERILRGAPGVSACAVIGCPDPEWGERVVAVVVPDPACPPAAESLVELCRSRLATYKCPREVRFVDDLPRNALGKVQKAILRREICASP